jgi:putative membrane protein
MKWIRAFVMSLALIAVQRAARAHGSDGEPGPATWVDLARDWELSFWITFPLSISALLYFRGVSLLWKRTHAGAGIGGFELACFCAGWGSLAIALVSPLHAWGRALFAAHMTQHELLMLAAAPLLALSKPALAMFNALPRGWPSAIVHTVRPFSFLTGLFTAWLVHAIALWIWHVPFLFDATSRSELVHALQHVSFFGSAMLFWWAILHSRPRVASYGIGVLYLFSTAMHSGLLGALLTYARTSLYPSYEATTAPWGLTPLEDQQLGGLIMWVPAGLVYVFAALLMLAGWLKESDRHADFAQGTIP